MRKTTEKTVLLCESCEYAMECRTLKPCDQYVPAKGTNFFDEKSSDHVLHRHLGSAVSVDA